MRCCLPAWPVLRHTADHFDIAVHDWLSVVVQKAQPHQGQQGPPEAGSGGAGGSGAAGANNDRRPRGENWKTRLCQEFMATGQCRQVRHLRAL